MMLEGIKGLVAGKKRDRNWPLSHFGHFNPNKGIVDNQFSVCPLGYAAMAYVVIAYMVVAYVVIAYILIACIVVADIVTACTVTIYDLYSHRPI